MLGAEWGGVERGGMCGRKEGIMRGDEMLAGMRGAFFSPPGP